MNKLITSVLFLTSFNVLLLAQTSPAPAPTPIPQAKVVTLKVEAEGTPPLAYQWYRNDIPIAGATQAQLVLNPFTVEQSGLYHCRVTNEVGFVDSNKATLIAIKQPTIKISVE